MTDPNPYLLTAIASGSALLGVALATAAQIFTARSVRRSQRELLETQSEIAARQYLHAERRVLYAQYLDAVDVTLGLLAQFRVRTSLSDQEVTETVVTTAWLTVTARLESVRLLGPSAVTDAADAVCEYLTRDITNAVASEPPVDGFGGLYSSLLAEMQSGLGISPADRTQPPALDA